MNDPAAPPWSDPRSRVRTVTPPAHADLAEAARGLVDAVVRTELEPDQLAEVAAQLRGATQTLLTRALSQPRNLAAVGEGRLDDSGNPAVGARNPIAPPLRMQIDGEDRVSCALLLGAGYEGPPGCVHGGVVAMVLDQVMGTVPWLAGRPGMTAYLNLDYRRPTRLGLAHTAVAWRERTEGWKTYVRGEIRDADGEVTVEAEGLFITPRAARGEGAQPQSD